MTTRQTPRRNERGEWRCCRCQGYFPESEFTPQRGRKHRPRGYCRACHNHLTAMRHRSIAFDEERWQEELERVRRLYQRVEAPARRRVRRERGEMARVLLADIRSRGLSQVAVERITGVVCETQCSIERGGECRNPSVLDRIVVLHQVCQDIPAWRRVPGRHHPHLAVIQRRYQAVREAQA